MAIQDPAAIAIRFQFTYNILNIQVNLNYPELLGKYAALYDRQHSVGTTSVPQMAG
jgi:hypothetical protein